MKETRYALPVETTNTQRKIHEAPVFRYWQPGSGPSNPQGGKQAGEPQLSAWKESQAAQVRGAQAEPSGLPKVSRVGLGTHAILGGETRRGSPPSPAASQLARCVWKHKSSWLSASGTGAKPLPGEPASGTGAKPLPGEPASVLPPELKYASRHQTVSR